MNDKMNVINDFLKSIGNDTDADLAFDDDGLCSVVAGGDTIVNVKYDEGRDNVLFFSAVCTLDQTGADRADTLEKLMYANYFRADTEGFTVGLDRETSQLVIFDYKPADYFDSAETLAAVIATASIITQKLRRIVAGSLSTLDEPENDDSTETIRP